MSYSTELVGLIASLIGIISFLPLLYTIYRTKNTKNFPYITLTLSIISNLLWVIYGYLEKALSTTVIGLFYLITYTFIFIVKTFN